MFDDDTKPVLYRFAKIYRASTGSYMVFKLPYNMDHDDLSMLISAAFPDWILQAAANNEAVLHVSNKAD